ncbi:MAG: LPS export ABC transporter periplasmic protein LptC [Roseivirga sp.]
MERTSTQRDKNRKYINRLCDCPLPSDHLCSGRIDYVSCSRGIRLFEYDTKDHHEHAVLDAAYTLSMNTKYYFFTPLLLSLVFGFANEEGPLYEGPALESTQLETICSENGVVKYIFTTKKALHYENGDKAYPEGVHLSFYQADQEKSTELKISVTGRANSAYYWSEKKVYEFRGDVEIKSLREKKQLNTDMLYFDPETDTFYTDKFIRIETEHDMLTGEGLTAKRDLSHYSVPKPQGNFNVDSAAE